MVQAMDRDASDENQRDASPEGERYAAGSGTDRGGGDAAIRSAGDGETSPEAGAVVRSLIFEDSAAASLPPIPSPGPVRGNRGGARPGAGRKPASGKSKPESKPAAAQTASTARPRVTIDTQAAGALLALAEGGLVMAVGPEAALNDYERTMIEPPLGRMLARMAPESAARVAAFADPITLLVGIGAYVSRVFMTRDRNARTESGPRRPAARPTTTPGAQPAPVRPGVVVVPNGPPADSVAAATNGAITRDDLEIGRELGGI